MALSQRNRLKKKKEFDTVFKKGDAIKGTFLFIKTRDNGTSTTRFGFIIPVKVISSAVARNRIKRVLSSVAYLYISKFVKGRDLVVTVRKKEERDKLKEELLELLSNLK